MSESVVPKSERRSLRYDFSAVETHDFALKLAGKTKELTSKTEEKKAVVSQWNATIEAIKSELTKLSNFISDGFEYRDVECTVEFNKPEPGRKLFTRSDTGETFDERMEQWEHNLFTQVNEDDMLDSPLGDPTKNPDTSVKRKSRKKQKQDDILDDLENI